MDELNTALLNTITDNLYYFSDSCGNAFWSHWSPDNKIVFQIYYPVNLDYIRTEFEVDIQSFQNRLNNFSCQIRYDLTGGKLHIEITR